MAKETERKRCRNILDSIHMVFGMDSVAVAEDAAFAHAASCPDCRRNLDVAAAIAGLQKSLDTVTPWNSIDEVKQVNRVVEAALRENRLRLANAYYELGRVLFDEGAGNGVVREFVKPLKTEAEVRLEGLEAIHSARSLVDKDEIDWAKENENFIQFLKKENTKPLEKSQEALEIALRVDPRNENAMNWLGGCLGYRGDFRRASTILSDLINQTESPGFVVSGLTNLAWLVSTYSDFRKAIYFAREAASIGDCDHIMAALNYFLLSVMNQDWSESRDSGKTLFKFSEKKSEAFINIKTQFLADKDSKFWNFIESNKQLRVKAEELCSVLFKV